MTTVLKSSIVCKCEVASAEEGRGGAPTRHANGLGQGSSSSSRGSRRRRRREESCCSSNSAHGSSGEGNRVVQRGVRSREGEGDHDNGPFGSGDTPTVLLCSCSCRRGEPPQTLSQCRRWAGGEAVTAHPAPLELTSGRRCRSRLRPG